MISLIDIDREMVRRHGLHEFVKRAWHLLEPAKFVDNWHLNVICEHLEACASRQIRRLLINIPPGCMKSLSVSVFYPAWLWIQNPAEKFIYASYDSSLSERDAKKHRDIICSQWFQERWGDKVHLPPAATKQVRMFVNSGMGFRYSTSVGGPMTGRHGDQLWIDDPIKPKDTQGGAEVTRTKLEESYVFRKQTLSTRQANPQTTVQGVMMQRLHDADLVGRLLEEGGWEHLMLPMKFEKGRACVTSLGLADPRTEDDELLWPDRYDAASVAQLEIDLGEYASAQLQQNPVSSTGGIFEAAWFKQFWSYDGLIPGTIQLPAISEMMTLQSWDMAFKDKASSDFVAGHAWGLQGTKFFLFDREYGKMSFGASKDAMRRLSSRQPRILTKLVEDKANGTAVVDDLKDEILGLEAVNPEGGKVARAHVSSALYRAGHVWLPHPSIPGFEWVTGFITEHLRFPRGVHDDDVDAESQGLLRLSTQHSLFLEAMRAWKAEEAAAAKAALPPPQAAVDLPHAPPPNVHRPGAFAAFLARRSAGGGPPSGAAEGVGEAGDHSGRETV